MEIRQDGEQGKRRTEISGGTDGALSSGEPFVFAEMGNMRLDFPAGGCAAEDAKKVADTVAVCKIITQPVSQYTVFSNVDQKTNNTYKYIARQGRSRASYRARR